MSPLRGFGVFFWNSYNHFTPSGFIIMHLVIQIMVIPKGCHYYKKSDVEFGTLKG
jgi:hypothetical protein